MLEAKVHVDGNRPTISEGKIAVWAIIGTWLLQIDRTLQYPLESIGELAGVIVRLFSIILEKLRQSGDNPED